MARGVQPTAESLAGESKCEAVALAHDLVRRDVNELAELRQLAEATRDNPAVHAVVVKLLRHDLEENRLHRELIDAARGMAVPA
jgi:hypothetical protein